MSQDGKHTPSVISVVGVVALLITCMFVLFSGVQRFDAPIVEADLKDFAEYVAAEAHKHGRDAKLSHGDVNIVGWGYDKRAIIHNVSLEISQPGLFDTNRWLISTETMVLRPDHMSAERLIADFNDPINIVKNSNQLYTVRFSDTLNYTHSDGKREGVRIITDSVLLPKKIVLVPALETAEGAAEPAPMEITYNPNYDVHFRLWPESNKTEAVIGLENLKISQNGKPLLIVGALTSSLYRQPNEQQHQKGQFIFTAIDFFLKGDSAQRKPYTLNLDVGYVSDAQGSSNYVLNKCALMNNDFKLKATGNFTTTQDDPLPFGKVMLELTNSSQFLNSNLVPEHSRPALTEVLQKISGAPAPAMDNLSIPINREKNQVLYFGKMTFEEVAASLVAGLIQSPPAAKTILPPMQGTPDAQ